MQKDIRLEIRARNNLILTRMEAKGITSVSELCRRMGPGYLTKQTRVGLLVNMKMSARVDDGVTDSWIPLAVDLANFFQCLPEDLFSEPQQYQKLTRNRIKAEIAFADIQRLTFEASASRPDELYERRQIEGAVRTVLGKLTPREERVLRMRFGIGAGVSEMPLDKVGDQIHVNRERVRQIEVRALQKLRGRSNRKLRSLLDSFA